jgi:hypothetical protein
MPASRPSPSQDRSAKPVAAPSLVDHGFVPVRARLIDVAAFLDRVERHGVATDFRCVALREAAAVLVDGKPERARRILEALSDPTTAPAVAAAGKAAMGAWQKPTRTAVRPTRAARTRKK